jgi:hypothetical protein
MEKQEQNTVISGANYIPSASPSDEEHHCNTGGLSLTLFLLISALIVIIISTIDFHTGLIWSLPPKVNAEIRYMVTVIGILVLFIFTYCQHMKVS